MLQVLRLSRLGAWMLCMLMCIALAACGNSASTSSTSSTGDIAPSASTIEAAATPEGTSTVADVGGPGIDQTKLNICAIIPRTSVEAVIGPLAAAPKASLPIGNEVGCDYTSDARYVGISVYNLDRWELFTKGLEGKPVSGVGDGGFMAEEVDGSHTLYVLLRGRAVIGVHLSGENMQEFRKLVDATQAQIS